MPLLGNAHHRHRVREVLATFGVQTVYHAAAYKHVPIVEHNVVEGIHNNVISTWYTAEAALETGVETFVLVSTDKAVNPANVMGATKRLAELVLQALQERTTQTRFCMVRFGNVLASSGSVVPLFQEQIRRGGPVTVTHPDVIRYFMTIPEAAQLVMQAGSMAKGGDVFVLDMGRPVRIDDLARRLINLMGLTVRDANNPDGDIEIEYTGLRTAEKLFEELLIGTERHRYRPPDDHARHGAPPALAEDAADPERPAGRAGELRLPPRARAARPNRWPNTRRSRTFATTSGRARPCCRTPRRAKVADFAAKRRLSEAGKPTQGQNPRRLKRLLSLSAAVALLGRPRRLSAACPSFTLAGHSSFPLKNLSHARHHLWLRLRGAGDRGLPGRCRQPRRCAWTSTRPRSSA